MTIQHDFSLKEFNTFHIDAKARFFAALTTVEDIQELLIKKKYTKNLLVLGGGSNLLLTKDFDGFVLKNELKGIDVIHEDNNHYYVKAAAGENWHRFVMYCIERNFAGVENLSLIPGSIGASPMQNIGAYGVEIKDVFESLEAVKKDDGTVHTFTNNDCRFGYRESIFKHEVKDQYIITYVIFRLNKIPQFSTSYGAINDELSRMKVKELSIKAISQAVINIRQSKLPDPAKIGNAGSFFKNPSITNEAFLQLQIQYPLMPHFLMKDGTVKIPAAWLIEQCGWKGYRNGDAGVHIYQPLVLVNYGNASGDEIYQLSELILKSIHQKFDIVLEREVNIV